VHRRLQHLTFLVLAPALALAPRTGLGAEIRILNKNDSGKGFNDPTAVPPVGLNFGTTRGQQALVAFQYAATIWGATLKTDVPILIDSAFVSVADDSRLTCTTTNGIVGYARLASYASGGEYPVPGAGYPVALANALAGRDLTSGGAQIVARFNASIGTQGCLDNQSWYYGLDGRESSAQDDLVSVLLHEFGHGLGFISFVDASSGSFGSDPPAIFDYHAWDVAAGRTWAGETDAVRKLLATGVNELALAGPGIATDIPRFLSYLPQLDVDVVGLQNPVPIAPADFSAPYTGGGAVVAALPLDGCTALANGADIAGKVALIQRGGTDPDGGLCRFWDKANRAQDAGAAGVILFNNQPGAGLVNPTGMPALSIPVGFVTFETGSAIQAQLDGGTVSATFGTSNARGGTDPSGDQVLLYTPATVVSASSVSHWDTTAYPALLMEPRILHNFRQDLDLTPAVMADLGWSVIQGLSLAMAKALDQTITPGANAYYLVTVVNRRPEAANDVTMDLALPAGASVVSTAGACTTGSFPCSLGTVASGDVKLTVVTVSVPKPAESPFVVSASLITSPAGTDDVLQSSSSVPIAGAGSGCTSAGESPAPLLFAAVLAFLLRRRAERVSRSG
jgi:hypothetical protein